MSAYNQTINFSLHPCSLRDHDWREVPFGLAGLARVKTCSRCGEASYPHTPTTGCITHSVDIDKWLGTIPEPIEPG